MARSSWKGHIRLSLVSIPVKAFTASASGHEIRLNQLHEECKSRIRYQKVCPQHGEISSSEIVKGYEFTKDQYVIVDEEELDELRTESDRAISAGYGKFDVAGVCGRNLKANGPSCGHARRNRHQR